MAKARTTETTVDKEKETVETTTIDKEKTVDKATSETTDEKATEVSKDETETVAPKATRMARDAGPAPTGTTSSSTTSTSGSTATTSPGSTVTGTGSSSTPGTTPTPTKPGAPTSEGADPKPYPSKEDRKTLYETSEPEQEVEIRGKKYTEQEIKKPITDFPPEGLLYPGTTLSDADAKKINDEATAMETEMNKKSMCYEGSNTWLKADNLIRKVRNMKNDYDTIYEFLQSKGLEETVNKQRPLKFTYVDGQKVYHFEDVGPYEARERYDLTGKEHQIITPLLQYGREAISPVSKISLDLEEVFELCKNGYKLRRLSTGEIITKRNYLNYIITWTHRGEL